MPKVVVDASVVIKWLTKKNEEKVLEARKIYELMVREEVEIVSPLFLILEVLNILIRKKKSANQVVGKLIKRLINTEINFKEMGREDIENVKRIVFKYDTTSYDAVYLAIAEEEKCKLLTMDSELLKIQDLTVDLDEFLQGFST